MKIVIYFLSVLFCLLQSTNSQEIEEFYIGYYDLEEDKRYDLWGVHPVDIRSQTNRVDRRPRAGALLGIEDIKPFQRMAKTKFHLITKRFTKQEKIKDKDGLASSRIQRTVFVRKYDIYYNNIS